MSQLDPPYIETLAQYRQRFTDAGFWRPYVEAVCRRHQIAKQPAIRAGLPGTNPVFLVDERYVVKFYSHFFDGAASYAVEREIYRLVSRHRGLPAPALVANGDLLPAVSGWRWPYIITTVVPGHSLSELIDEVGAADLRRLAQDLGLLLRRIHSLPLEDSALLRPDWTAFLEFLARQRAGCADRHRRWGTLPAALVKQIDDYLPPLEWLVGGAARPVLLHCDLNADHLLGVLRSGHWHTTGLIDFGDSRVGDPLYELPALHLGLFGGDRTLLRACLEAYGQPLRHPDLPRRALSYTLLHEFDVLEPVSPRLQGVDDLQGLALLLWDIGYGEPGAAAG